MTREEKYISRLMLKNKILEANKQAYEDLFIQVMQNKDPNFKPVKPHGNYGDRKNDGFNIQTGEYYQVYAPETFKGKERDTINKLIVDFDGLYKHWNKSVLEVKHFYYVLNDKYNGAYPVVYEILSEIAKKYNIKSEPLLSKNLEDIVLTLDEDKIVDIVGFIPSVLDTGLVGFDIMSEVVKHIMNVENPYKEGVISDDPNFGKKVQFNNLSNFNEGLLNSSRIQSYIINDYFELNSDFTREELRAKFNGLYLKGIKEIKTKENKNDQVFLYILEKASPRQNKAVKDAVLVLMAYYFEYCDIFEDPS